MNLKDFRSVYFPYCLEKQPDGRYAVLNRDYNPVGFHTTGRVTYADFPVLVTLKGLTPALAGEISDDASQDTDRVFLYRDGTNPVLSQENLDAYLDKLALLAKLSLVD